MSRFLSSQNVHTYKTQWQKINKIRIMKKKTQNCETWGINISAFVLWIFHNRWNGFHRGQTIRVRGRKMGGNQNFRQAPHSRYIRKEKEKKCLVTWRPIVPWQTRCRGIFRDRDGVHKRGPCFRKDRVRATMNYGGVREMGGGVGGGKG